MFTREIQSEGRACGGDSPREVNADPASPESLAQSGRESATRIVSLFSGAGGFDLGMIRANHSIVWANDIDKDSCETYAKNIGSHISCGNISMIDSSAIPECDVIIGGFPCQGFSQANLLRSSGDERNTLYLQFLRVLRAKMPLYFLAENVRGILSLDGGSAIRTIVADFESVGYRVSYKVFNAADFGVPAKKAGYHLGGESRHPSVGGLHPPISHALRFRPTWFEALD